MAKVFELANRKDLSAYVAWINEQNRLQGRAASALRIHSHEEEDQMSKDDVVPDPPRMQFRRPAKLSLLAAAKEQEVEQRELLAQHLRSQLSYDHMEER